MPRTITHALAVVNAVAFAATASGQIAWMGGAEFGIHHVAFGPNQLGQFNNQGVIITDLSDGFGVKTDWNYHPHISNATHTSDLTYLTVRRTFEVGPFPVQWQCYQLSHFKLVNGGGTATQPESSVDVITQLIDDSSGLTVLMTPHFSTVQNGNGFVVENLGVNTVSYVLGAGLRYTLEMSVPLSVSVAVPTNSIPAIAVTLEAGAQSSAYTGFKAWGDFTVVPAAPAALTLCGALAIAWRRKRG